MKNLKKSNTLMIRPVRIIVFIILAAFLSILISFDYLNGYKNKRDNDDKLILNLYGKQKMLTQEIGKDSASIYMILQSGRLENDDLYFTDQRQLDDIKAGLKLSGELFSEILEATQSGRLTWESYKLDIRGLLSEASGQLNDITTLWSDFEKAIDIILGANELNDEVTEAARFIAENNMVLLEQVDSLQDIIIKEAVKYSERLERLFRILIGLFSTIAFVALFYLLRYIIFPFNALYKGLTETGLNEIPKRPGFPTRKKIAPMVDEINGLLQKFDDLISLIENINNNSSLTEVLNFINSTFSKIIPYNYIGIALLNEDKTQLIASYGVSDGNVHGLPENMIGKTFNINDTSLGNLITNGKARIINDLEEYTKGKPVKMYNRIILDAGIRASITLPLKVSGEPVGIIFFSSIKKNVYHEGHLNFLGTLADSIAISFYQNAYIENIIYSSILALAKLAEARDVDTGEHLERIKVYSRIIAEILYENDVYTDEVNWEFIHNVERYSQLHDIGKVGIADSILLNTGKLTAKEFEEMKKHTIYGARVLRIADQNINRRGHSLFGLGIEIAESHHEKWDGTGYPYGKKGLEIPLSARIVAIADVFDALTSRRHYKEPLPFEDAIKIINEEKGTRFDPNILEPVMANKHLLRKAYYSIKDKKNCSKANIINL